MMRYDVSVMTRFYRADGTLFADLGTFFWPSVSEDMRVWLAASCRTTAMRMVSLPEHPGGYTLAYRTKVWREGEMDAGLPVSDTGLIEFPNLSYQQVIDFEHFALAELRQMIDLFEREHASKDTPPRERSKIKALWSFVRAWMNRNVA